MKPVAWSFGLAAALLAAGCGGSSAPPPPAQKSSSKATQGSNGPGPEENSAQEISIDEIAQLLLDEAAQKEKGQTNRPEVALAAYHAVCVRHPFTEAGKRAAKKCVEIEGLVQVMIEVQFNEPRRDATALASEGRFAEAVEGLAKYSESASGDAIKRCAARLIAELENDARRAYVAAVRAARKSIAAGAFDEAVQTLKAASVHSIPEIRDAAERDLVLLDRYRRAEEAKRSMAAEEAAQKAFGERAARLVKRLKERAYAEVLKDLDSAIADPALAAVKDRLTADRAVVVHAAAFWEAIQKSLKARKEQELVLKTTDGKTVRGTLKRIHESGTSVRLEAPAVEVPLDTLHADSLILLAINRDGLAEDSSASYAAAAMWFFLEGRHAVSRLELATASELGADMTLLEPAWRHGFFRATLEK
jgi:hypothetical protein